jgi:hypothetical protein
MLGWFVWIARLSTACSLAWPLLGQPAPTAQSHRESNPDAPGGSAGAPGK